MWNNSIRVAFQLNLWHKSGDHRQLIEWFSNCSRVQILNYIFYRIWHGMPFSWNSVRTYAYKHKWCDGCVRFPLGKIVHYVEKFLMKIVLDLFDAMHSVKLDIDKQKFQFVLFSFQNLISKWWDFEEFVFELPSIRCNHFYDFDSFAHLFSTTQFRILSCFRCILCSLLDKMRKIVFYSKTMRSKSVLYLSNRLLMHLSQKQPILKLLVTSES